MQRKLEYFCEIDGNYYSKITIVRLLKPLGIDKKVYYDAHYRKENEGYCLFCNKETKFLKFTYYKYCNMKCAAQHNNNTKKLWESLTKEEKTKMTKKIVKTRKLNNNLDDMMEKRRNTYIRLYGITKSEYHSINTKKYFNELSQENRIAFGRKIALNRTNYNLKPYTLNGIVEYVQGYEPYVLVELIKYFDEKDIIVKRKDVPHIKYFDENHIKHTYFPDIWIKKFNLIIEVKSPFTLNIHKNITVLKQEATIESGYKYLLVMWDNRSKKSIEQSKNKLNETISSQAHLWNEKVQRLSLTGVDIK